MLSQISSWTITAWKVSKYGVIFGPYFPAFDLSVFSLNAGKYVPEITPYLGTFQVVHVPLIWKFAGKSGINKICKIYNVTLLVVYSEYQKFYEELLQINKGIYINKKHLKKASEV